MSQRERNWEVELAESEERWRQLVENHPEPIYVTVGGRIRYINPSGVRIFAAPGADALIGTSVLSFVDPGVRDAMQERLAQIERGAPTEPMEHRMIRPDGEARIVITRSVPVRYEGEAAAQTVIRDVTDQRRAEAALKEQERLLAATLQQMPAGVIIVEAPSGRIARYNEEAERLLGHPRLAAEGVAEYDRYRGRRPDGTPYEAEDYPTARALNGETVRHEEMLYPRGEEEGAPRVLSVSAAPLRDDDGRIVQAVCTVQDVTAHKHAEAELRESQALYEALTQSYPFGAIVVYDHDLRYILAGGQELEMVGLDADEMVGQTIWEVFPPETCALIEADYRKALAGTPVTSEVPYKDQVYINHDVPIRDDAGAVIAGLVVTMNITQQKRAEAELTQSKAFAERLIQALPDGFSMVDEDRVQVQVNEAFCRMTGYAPEELVGATPPYPYWPPEAHDTLQAAFRRILEGEAQTYELAFKRKSGERFPVLVTTASLHDADGSAFYCATVKDITERKQAEQALQQSEERFRGVSEQAVDVIVLFDAEGRFKYLSPSVEEMTGYPRDQLLGTDGFAPVHPADSAAVRGAFERAAQQAGATVEVEGRYRHRDGSWRHLSIRGRRLPTSDGSVEVLANVRDITKRKEAEQALVEAKERAEEMGRRYEMALLGGDLGFWDLNLNTRRNVVNARWAEMLGYTLDEVGNSQDFFDDHVHPDDLERAYAMLERHARGEIPMIDLEIRIRAKDGTWRWVQDRGTIMEWNADGSPRRVVGTHMDITERKRQESIEQRFGRLLDTSVKEIYVFDAASLRFIQVSRGGQENVGYTMDELRTLTPVDLKPYEHAAFEALLEPLRTGTRDEVAFETTHRRKDGSTYPVEVHLQMSRQEEPPVFIAIVLDITSRERRERELIAAKEEAEEMSRLKSAFLANMSHEIRTPLTAIIGFADVLSGQVTEKGKRLLKMIRMSGERLERTLTSILELAQIESRSMTLRREPVDVGDEARNMAAMLQGQADKKGIALHVDVPDAPVEAHADRDAVQRILSNLIANAVKFTPDGYVRISVAEAPETNQVAIRVEDTGIGIQADQMDHIFMEFGQESQGYSRDYEGSGLGLKITSELVELLQGTIDVQSTKGEGSVFTVRLPRAGAEAEGGEAPAPGASAPEASAPDRAAAADARADAHQEGAQATLLFIDDNAPTRQVVPMLIEEIDVGCAVDVAATADEALDKARSTPYDLFLVDINLGTKTTGIDVMEALRADRAYASAPMVACTAYAMPGDEEKFLALGFDAYLAKPFQKEQLADVIRNALRDAAS